MKIFLLNMKWFTINKSVYTPLSENKEKRAEIVWFGFSSPRGAFRLKTTLHGGGGGLMLMVDNRKLKSMNVRGSLKTSALAWVRLWDTNVRSLFLSELSNKP